MGWVISRAIFRARGGSCSRPMSWQTISSIEGVWETGQASSTASAMRLEYFAYSAWSPATKMMSGQISLAWPTWVPVLMPKPLSSYLVAIQLVVWALGGSTARGLSWDSGTNCLLTYAMTLI